MSLLACRLLTINGSEGGISIKIVALWVSSGKDSPSIRVGGEKSKAVMEEAVICEKSPFNIHCFSKEVCSIIL